MELQYLNNNPRVFFYPYQKQLEILQAFWRPRVNLSMFIGEDGLEEEAFLPRGNPNNKEYMPNKVEYGSLPPWIQTDSLNRNHPPSPKGNGCKHHPPALGRWLIHHLFWSHPPQWIQLPAPPCTFTKLGRVWLTHSPNQILNVNWDQ